MTLSGAGGVTLGAKTLTLTDASTTFSGAIGGTGGLTLTDRHRDADRRQHLHWRDHDQRGRRWRCRAPAAIAASSGVADGGTFDISAATAGASIKTLSGAGAVVLGAETLTLTAGAGIFSGVIGGTGGLTVDGSGTETLSGVNTYSGATTIGFGETLALSGSGSIAASSGVADGGTFDISATTAGASIKTLSGAALSSLGAETLTLTNGSGTFSGVIGGTGGLTVDGSGTETLSGVNTYGGATTIGTGETLALSGSGSIAASSGVADGGTFDISAATAAPRS